MKCYKRKAAIFGIVVAVAAFAWILLKPSEPSYKGKSINYWLNPWAHGGKENAEEISEAFRSMGEKAVPFLVRKLQWEPSKTNQKAHRFFPNWLPGILHEQGASDPRNAAAHALGEIGDAARSSIPQLEVAASLSDLGSSWAVNVAAKAALIKIKQESLFPYIEKLKDKSDLNTWYQNAMMLGEFGTNAAGAVPLLVESLDSTNHPVIQAHAAIALGMIHSQPELCIEELAAMLKSPNVVLRQKAIFALPQFGAAAKPAWSEMVICLQDSDSWTRQSATNALKQIDPDAAKSAGVK